MLVAKILILGVYGFTGRLLARHLLVQSQAEIILGGRHVEKAQGYADQLNAEFAGGSAFRPGSARWGSSWPPLPGGAGETSPRSGSCSSPLAWGFSPPSSRSQGSHYSCPGFRRSSGRRPSWAWSSPTRPRESFAGSSGSIFPGFCPGRRPWRRGPRSLSVEKQWII